MSYTPYPSNREINTDASGRTRSSLINTLFDGKCLGADNPLIWENVGTGTSSFVENQSVLSVTAGQYMIRRGRHVMPYFSGKSQSIEMTFDNFAPATGLTRVAGYFSSSAVAPYTATKDGFWIESDGTTVRFVVSRAGVVVHTADWTTWDNYDRIAGYNWNNFTIVKFDFLWLGGSEIRLFVKTVDGFVLAHTYEHASTTTNSMIVSPQHSVRYELRSTTGVGTFDAICSDVASEGSSAESGMISAVYNATALAVNTAGTVYPLKGIRKLAAFRDTSVTLTGATVTNTGVADTGTLLLLLNPVLSTPLNYVTLGKIQDGTAVAGSTVTNVGTVLHTCSASAQGSANNLNTSILAQIGMSIADVSDQLVLAYQSASATQSVFGSIMNKQY